MISTGLTIFFGTAGLPHILMRFFTVPDGKAAASPSCGRSASSASSRAGHGHRLRRRALLVGDSGDGGRRQGRQPRRAAAGAVPRRRGGPRAATCARPGPAAAFATFLAVVSGLVLASVEHDRPRPLGQRDPRTAASESTRPAWRGGRRSALVTSPSPPPSSSAPGVQRDGAGGARPSGSRPAPTSRRSARAPRGGASTPRARSPASPSACIASVVMIVLSPPVWPGPDSSGLAVRR